MTQLGGIPVTKLREMLNATDDETLVGFLHSYALGVAADTFIAGMVRPTERVNFLVTLAGTYQDDWNRAVEILAKGVPK